MLLVLRFLFCLLKGKTWNDNFIKWKKNLPLVKLENCLARIQYLSMLYFLINISLLSIPAVSSHKHYSCHPVCCWFFLVWDYSMNPLLSILISCLLLISLDWYVNVRNSLRPGVLVPHSSPRFSSAVLLRQDLLSLWKGSPFLDCPSIHCTLHPCL